MCFINQLTVTGRPQLGGSHQEERVRDEIVGRLGTEVVRQELLHRRPCDAASHARVRQRLHGDGRAERRLVARRHLKARPPPATAAQLDGRGTLEGRGVGQDVRGDGEAAGQVDGHQRLGAEGGDAPQRPHRELPQGHRGVAGQHTDGE